jgi:hypothetical protein
MAKLIDLILVFFLSLGPSKRECEVVRKADGCTGKMRMTSDLYTVTRQIRCPFFPPSDEERKAQRYGRPVGEVWQYKTLTGRLRYQGIARFVSIRQRWMSR